MKIKNFLLIIFSLIIGSLVLTKSAAAFWPFDALRQEQGQEEAGQQNGQSKFPPIVQKLIERFGLNEDEVSQVIEEEREERRQKGKEMMEQRLDEAVADGQITEEQKQAILEKQEQMEQEKGQHQEEMKQWAEENGIDWPMFGSGMRKGMGRGF